MPPEETPTPADVLGEKSDAPQGDAAKPEKQQAEAKTFTQDELDSILKGRLAKFADYDALKAKVAEVEDAAKSDTEKAVEAARAEARADALAEANKRLVNAETKVVATELGFVYPTDAHRFIDDVDALVGDDGMPDASAIKAALEAVAKDRPALVKGTDTPKPPSASDAGIGQTSKKSPSTAEIFAAALGGN